MFNRTHILLLVLILSLAMLAIPAASMPVPVQANWRCVTLQNDSGIVFAEIHVSSTKGRTWEPDLIGNNVLRSGLGFTVAVPEGKWDFKFIDGAGDSCTIHDVIVKSDLTWDLTPDWLAKSCTMERD